jgi:hypothetical protein
MLGCGRVVPLSTLQVVCRRETAQTRLVAVVSVMSPCSQLIIEWRTRRYRVTVLTS